MATPNDNDAPSNEEAWQMVARFMEGLTEQEPEPVTRGITEEEADYFIGYVHSLFNDNEND